MCSNEPLFGGSFMFIYTHPLGGLSMQKDIILTEEGLEKLKDELQTLKTVRRKEVAERIKQAIDFGDLSENSEYDDAKNEQAFIEGRIQTLENMLRNVSLISKGQEDNNTVEIGSKVTVLDVELEEEEVYRIVGTIEADPMNNFISNESPLGQALIGAHLGDVISVEAPVGKIDYKITNIFNE